MLLTHPKKNIFSDCPLQFGKGHYQLTYLNSEKGEPKLRGDLLEEKQLALLENPKGDFNYLANALLLQTYFDVKDYRLGFAALQQSISHFFSLEEQTIFFETQENVRYALINLDQFSVLLDASEEYSKDYYWVALVDENKKIIGHICFHANQVNIFSDEALIVSGEKNTTQALSINTLSDVLINQPLKTEKNIHVNCRSLMLHSLQQDVLLLKSNTINVLCFDEFTTTIDTDILAENCQIRAGRVLHQGYIESTQSIHIISELVDIQGTIAAQGKNGISIVSLGMLAQKASHLHGSKLNLLVGIPADGFTLNHPFLGKLILNGVISTQSLLIYADDTLFDQSETYVQGKITLANIHKTVTTTSATLFFKGESIQQYSGFSGQIDWTVIEDSSLEIYWKKIIYGRLSLSENEQKRSELPKALVHSSAKENHLKSKVIEYLPALSKQEDYLYKSYDKTQFPRLETEPSPRKEKQQSEMVFSAGEYLSMQSKMALSSAKIHIQAEHLECFFAINRTSSFGFVDVFLQSNDFSLRDAEIHTDGQGQAILEAKNMTIMNSSVRAGQITAQTETLSFPNGNKESKTTLRASGKIMLKSKKNSTIPKGSALLLESPFPVTWECENFYLRGRMEFQQLSIKAKKLVSMVRADLKGKQLHVDAKTYVALFSRFKIEKSFSIQSVISITGFCIVLSEIYTNTSIVNLSSSLYLPSSLSLSGRSLLSCFLAAANTLISILQLVLHDPTAQLALMATRLAINAGPALVQLYQLVKNIIEATRAPQLERGQLISIANQVKTVCLSLGSLAYSVPGVVDQFAHASSVTEWTIPSWDNASTVIDNLTNVTTPLMSAAFPGVQNSNFFHAGFDFKFGFASTTSSIFDISGGVEGSLIDAHSTIVDAVLPGSFNVSPVLFTKTSFYSVSASPEFVLPVGVHSERTTYKTYVGTGIPSLPHHVSLTADKITVVNDAHEFKDSTIQTNELNVMKNAGVLVTDSSLKATYAHNAGQVEFIRSQVSTHDWQNEKDGTALWEQSTFKSDTLENQGFIDYVQTKVHIEKNHDSTTAVTQLATTEFNADEWKEEGLFAGEAFSHITSHQVYLAPGSKVGSRTTNWDIDALENKSETPVSVNFQGTHPATPEKNMATVAFHYEDKSALTATLTYTGKIQYHSDTPLTIEKVNMVSVSPIGVDASTLTAQGMITNIASFSLEGTQTLNASCAKITVNGSLDLQGGNVNVKGGYFEAGNTLQVRGKKIDNKSGAEFIAQNGIRVESEEDLLSSGKKTVTTHTEKHHEWAIIEKTKTTTETDFKNNVYATAHGDVDFISTKGKVTLQGTDTIAPEGNIHVQAHGDINLLPMLGENSTDKTYSSIIQHEHSSDKQDTASVCYFKSGGKTTFQLESGEFKNVGSIIEAENQITITVPRNHTITNQRLTLNISYTVSHTGLYLDKVAGFDLTSHQSLADHLPLVSAISQLDDAEGFMDKLAAGTELGEEAANLTNRWLTAARRGQLSGEALMQFGLGDQHGLNPILNGHVGTSRLEQKGQILGSGSITTPELVIHGGEADFQQGYEVHARCGVFDVETLKSSGATLINSTHVSDSRVEISTNLTQVLDVGVAHQQQTNVVEKHTASDNLQFSEQLELPHVHEVILDGSVIKTPKLVGEADYIKSRSPLDKIKSSGYQIGISSGGNFSIGSHNEQTEKVAVPYAFRVTDAHEFKTHDLDLVGQTAPNITSDHTETLPLYDVSHQHRFNFNASWRELLMGDCAAGNVFSAVRYGSSHEQYIARHDEHGVEVLYNSKDHFRFNFPVYYPSIGRQFLNNINWLFSTASFHDAPVVLHPVLPKESHRAAPIHSTKQARKSPELSVDFVRLYADSQTLDPSAIFSINLVNENKQDRIKVQQSEAKNAGSKNDNRVSSGVFPSSIGLGTIAELLEHDKRWVTTLSESYFPLLNSLELKTYLEEVEKNSIWKSETFQTFSDEILGTYTDWLRVRGSYLQYHIDFLSTANLPELTSLDPLHYIRKYIDFTGLYTQCSFDNDSTNYFDNHFSSILNDDGNYFTAIGRGMKTAMINFILEPYEIYKEWSSFSDEYLKNPITFLLMPDFFFPFKLEFLMNQQAVLNYQNNDADLFHSIHEKFNTFEQSYPDLLKLVEDTILVCSLNLMYTSNFSFFCFPGIISYSSDDFDIAARYIQQARSFLEEKYTKFQCLSGQQKTEFSSEVITTFLLPLGESKLLHMGLHHFNFKTMFHLSYIHYYSENMLEQLPLLETTSIVARESKHEISAYLRGLISDYFVEFPYDDPMTAFDIQLQSIIDFTGLNSDLYFNINSADTIEQKEHQTEDSLLTFPSLMMTRPSTIERTHILNTPTAFFKSTRYLSSRNNQPLDVPIQPISQDSSNGVSLSGQR